MSKAFRIFLCLALAMGISAHAEEFERGPDVVIIQDEDRVVYEFRQNGQLRMVRIVPKWGKPYYLVPRDDTKGFGDLERADMLLPQWVIRPYGEGQALQSSDIIFQNPKMMHLYIDTESVGTKFSYRRERSHYVDSAIY